MSLTRLKDEAAQLPLKEQRELIAFLIELQIEERSSASNECSEDDPALLAALDEAIARAGVVPTGGYSGQEVRSRVAQWTSKYFQRDGIA
jgi:hypothetical protein